MMSKPNKSESGLSVVEEVFLSSACEALREMVALEALAERTVEQVQIPIGEEWICASIELARQQSGMLRVWFDEETARGLASSYLGEVVELTPAIANDFAGELANVIAGQAKTMLKGTEHHFQMTLPLVRRMKENAGFSSFARINTEFGALWIELVESFPG